MKKKNSLLFRLVVLVAAMMSALGASAAEAYACYSPMTTTLTFYYDDYRSSLSGTTYDLNTGNNDPGWYTDGTRTNVTRVVFAPAFSGARPTTTRLWFSGMRNLQSITGLNYLNTSEVTNMEFMFGFCTDLTTLDLSSFNTSQVTDVSFMFSGSSSLRTIYVSSSWTTAAMTTSYGMFNNCTSLLGGQGTTWNSSNPVDKTYAHIDGGTNYPGYFTRDPNEPEAYACYTPSNTTLTFYYDRLRLGRTGTTYHLNYGNYQPDWVINSSYANVTRVVFDSSFADARPTTTYSWFYDMSNLETIEGMEYLNTSEVTDMTYMFYQCRSLTSLDLSSFNTSRVTSMTFMFYGCSNLQTIYAGDGWSTTAVRDDIWMFKGCTCLMGGMGTTYDANHTDKVYARIDGGPSNPGYFTATGTPVSYAYACYTPSNTTLTFYYDNQRFSRTGMTYTLNVGENDPGWVKDSINANVTKVVFTSSFTDALPTTTYRWFYQMSDLQSIEGINNLNTSEVTDMTYMFYQCRSLTSLDLSSFNTSRVTSMTFMFYGCSNLQTIYAGDGWSTTAVRDDFWMFKGCTSLVGGQGTTYDDNHTDKDYAHIDGGPSNPGYFTIIQEMSSDPYDFIENSIYYKFTGYNDVEVVNDGTDGYFCYSGNVEIPEAAYNAEDGWYYLVTSIGERAFYRCPSLVTVTIPATVCLIHNEAFVDCFDEFPSQSSITCLALTPPTASPTAFGSGEQSYVTLYVPYGKKSAYQAAAVWRNFSNIVELNYSFKKNGIYYKITGDSTVSVTYKNSSYNTYSGRVSIPRTVAFDGVTYTVTAIDHLAFYNCPNLTGVVIPETVTAIGNTSFKNCTSLTGITIPNSVTSMGMYAFQNCTSLTDVVIGSGMTSIGAMAFNGCEDLDRGTITCLALVPPTIAQQNTFDGGHYDYTVLYVPQSACADYQQAQYWGNFYDIRGIWSLDDALNDDGGSIHFESTGDYPWKVVSGGGARHYAESGNAGVASTTSTLTATVDVPESGATLSFVFKAWGEGNEDDRIYDACTFYIDGSARFEYGEYQNDWESYSVDLEAGTHTLKWSYSKDSSADPDGDYFAIDDVKLTPKSTVTLDDALNVDGGSIHFESTSAYPWKVVIDGGGAFSYAESGNAGVASTTSSLTATVDVPDGGATLSFMFQAWGEGYEEDRIYDACTFYIDGRARLEYGEYQNDWESYSVDLEAGTHTLKWSYSKDGSVDPEGDYFAINDVELTPKSNTKRGDVNGDGEIDVADVAMLIKVALGQPVEGFVAAAADLDDDHNTIDVGDVSVLINTVLGKTN